MTTTKPNRPRHRWAHPSDWLDYYMEQDTHDRDDIIQIAKALAGRLDGDSLQDLFQDEMDTDGYFKDLNLCPDCESRLTDRTTDGTHPTYCDECDREVEIP
jgi:hypothetical protein